MPGSIRVQGVLAKIEATYGVDPTPVPATDGVQVEGGYIWPDMTENYLQSNERNELAGGGMGRGLAGSTSGRWGQISFNKALKGAGSAYSASNKPEEDVLLRACGFDETVVTTTGSETVTYAPVSTGFESITIYGYTTGQLFKMLGCYGTVEITIQPGLIATARFTFSGMITADPTDVALPSIDYPCVDVVPPACKAAGLTLGSYDPDDFRSFVFNMQTLVEERPGGNASDGIAGFDINDWDAIFTTVIDKPALSSFNPWTYRQNRTAFAWDITVGATQYNKVGLSGPKGQILTLSQQADRAYGTVELGCRAANDTGDDAVEILYD